MLTEILKQSELSPMPFELQVVLIYAGTQGFLDDVPTSEIEVTTTKLLDYLDKMYREAILGKIRETGELQQESEEALKKALTEFKKL